MDYELWKKIKKVVGRLKLDDGTDTYDFETEFLSENDTLFKIIGQKGEFVYQLKELEELYSTDKEVKDIEPDWDDESYLSLLYAIELGITQADDDAFGGLTDTMVIRALERLSIKPELKDEDPIIKEINKHLRLCLSLSNFSRYEVKRAIRKILGSAKRHNKIDGIRGYLDFIREYLP